jgi:hypothetical protein
MGMQHKKFQIIGGDPGFAAETAGFERRTLQVAHFQLLPSAKLRVPVVRPENGSGMNGRGMKTAQVFHRGHI